MIGARRLWHPSSPDGRGAWCRVGDERIEWPGAAWCRSCSALGYDHGAPAVKAEAERHGEAARPCVVPCASCGDPTCDACADETGTMCLTCFHEGPDA